MDLPRLGEKVPRCGNRFTRGAAAFCLKRLGWRFEGAFPNHARMVVIVAPHTTAWDFGVAMLAIQALGLRTRWLGVDWAFRFPFLRALGGIPVSRTRSQGLVAQCVEQLKNGNDFLLALSPEGSRKRKGFRQGFYRIAEGAGVPVLPIGLDLRERHLLFGEVFHPSGDYDADLDRLREFYQDYLEKYSDCFEI